MFYLALLAFDVRQVVEGVGVIGTEFERVHVALFGFGDETLEISVLRLGVAWFTHLLFECVRQIAVRIGEVLLEFNRTAIGVDGQVD